jgi:hypothetical protein
MDVERERILEALGREFRPVALQLRGMPIPTESLQYLVDLLKQDPSSPLYDRVKANLMDAFEQTKKIKQGKKTIRVYSFLTEEQESILRAERPHLNIDFAGTDHMQHPMANANRAMDRQEQLCMVSRDEMVVELGGNVSQMILQGRKNWKVTVPIINYRDGDRHSVANSFEARILSGKVTLKPDQREVFLKWRERPDDYVFKGRAEECPFKADVIMCQHSMYDVGLENLARIMFRSGAKRAIGSLILNSDVIVSDKGMIRSQDATFYKERALDGKVTITFGFRNDPSFKYTHDFDEYARMYISQEVRHNGCMYYYHVYNRCADTVQFVMTKIPVADYNPVCMTSYIDTKRNTAVKLSGLHYDSASLFGPRRISYYVPYDTFTAVLDKIISEGGKWDRSQVHSYTRSHNHAFTINNIRQRGSRVMCADELEHFVNVIYALGESMLMNSRRDIKGVLDEISGVRNKTLLRRTVEAGMSYLWEFVSLRCPRNQFRNYLYSWTQNWAHMPGYSVEFGIEVVDWQIVDDGIEGTESFDEDDLTDQDLDEFSDEEMLKVLENLLETAEAIDRDEIEELADKLRKKIATNSETADDSGYSTKSDTGPECENSDPKSETTSSESSDEHDDTEDDQEDPEHLSQDIPFYDAVDEDMTPYKSILEFHAITSERHKNIVKEAIHHRGVIMTNLVVPTVSSVENHIRASSKRHSSEFTHHNFLLFHDGLVVRSLIPAFGMPSDYSVTLSNSLPTRAVKLGKKEGRVYGTGELANYSGWTYVNESFAIFNERAIANKVHQLIKQPMLVRSNFKTHAIFGVPGCGKTTYALSKLEDKYREKECSVLFVTAGRTPAVEFRELMAKRLGGDPEVVANLLRMRVRTADSYTMMPNCKATEIWIDEIYKLHAGQVYAMINFSEATSVVVMGDPQQIPYVNRARSVMAKYTKFAPQMSVEWLYKTYRFGPLIGAMMLHMYEGKARCHMISGSHENGDAVFKDTKVSLRQIDSLAAVPRRNDAQYLTMYQWEKAELIRSKYCEGHTSKEHNCRVRTADEFQGNQADTIIYVCLDGRPQKDMLYDNKRYVNSLLTRVRKEFIYYTKRKSCLLRNLIAHRKNIDIQRVQGEFDRVVDGDVRYNAIVPYREVMNGC